MRAKKWRGEISNSGAYGGMAARHMGSINVNVSSGRRGSVSWRA